MRKRLLAIALAMTSLLGLILLVLAMLPAKPGVTKTNLDRLAVGMTRNEVEAIFGSSCHGTVQIGSLFAFSSHDHQCWQGEDGFAIVKLDETGRVVELTWHGAEGSCLSKLRRLFP